MAFLPILFVAAISFLAADVPSVRSAAVGEKEKAQFNRMILALSEKVDAADYTAYRQGLIKDDFEFAVRVAKAFNEQAYRGLSPCSNEVTGTGRTITCGLGIPVVGENIVSAQVVFTATTVSVNLLALGKTIPMETYDLADFFNYGMTLSFSDALLNLFPGPLSIAKYYLIADLKLVGKHLPNGDGHICIAYAIGVRGPFGFKIPGFPYPSDVELLCANIQMTLPAPPGFFQRIIIQANLLGGWVKGEVGEWFTTLNQIVG